MFESNAGTGEPHEALIKSDRENQIIISRNATLKNQLDFLTSVHVDLHLHDRSFLQKKFYLLYYVLAINKGARIYC